MRTAIALAAIGVVALSGCGRQAELRPQPGTEPVPLAYGDEKPASVGELITPSPQLRPIRNEDLLRQSEPRAEDPYALPPGADNGR